MSSLVSIITPLFNSEEYVSETIDSLISQTYENWEMLIVDDNSTDRSYEVVLAYANKDSRIKVYKNDKGIKGGSVCRNIGIEKAKGKYIIFFDSDDFFLDHCLENRVRYMDEHSDLDFAVFQMKIYPEDSEYSKKYMTDKRDDYLQSFLRYNLPWATPCPIWKSEFLKANNYRFDERFPRLQDPEFHTRILLQENIKYTVFYEHKYADCAYRVAYKPINWVNFSKGIFLYITSISSILTAKKCNHLKSELSYLYDNYITYVTALNASDIRKISDLISEVNNSAFNEGIIDKKKYNKTKMFLYGIKSGLLNHSCFRFLLTKVGFYRFYSFKFGK